MTTATTLSQSLIGYAPLVDHKRNAMATRMTVRPASSATSYARLYAELAEACPPDAPPLILSVEGLVPDEGLTQLPVHDSIWAEIPAEVLTRPEGLDLARTLHRNGYKLVLNGRPEGGLAQDLIPAFRMSLIHVDNDRRLQAPAPSVGAPSSVKRSIPYAQVGVASISMMERCFATGAAAVVGWPFEDTFKHASSANSNPDFMTITKLIQLIDQGEDVGEMEALIRRDPALAYRLLRYINSPAFGLRVEVQSFRHAVMMLGYGKLRRWLMLLVTTSCKDANMRPIMFASFRRGLVLERLIPADDDPTMRDEVFILGVFSLLDKLFRESFETLFATLQVPERVQETLVDRTGPYAQYLSIVEALEQGPSTHLPDLLADAVMSVEQCNHALVAALSTTDLVSA